MDHVEGRRRRSQFPRGFTRGIIARRSASPLRHPSIRSSQISRQYGGMARGQLTLYAPSHTTPSSTMHGDFIVSIWPVCSSMMWLTRRATLGGGTDDRIVTSPRRSRDPG